jgi:RNA polymerase sigma-70 factor (ECF subfamily)
VEDKFLIEQVLKGNKNAYKLLVIRYQRPLFSFFKKFGFTSQRIEELAQEVFLKAYEHLSTFHAEKGSFSSWFFSIAKNLALNEIKKKSETLEEMEVLEQLTVSDSNESIDLLLGRKLTNEKVHALVMKIPNPFKIPVILSYLEELSIDEIAMIEKCSTGTVKSRIHRGKLALKNLVMNEELYDFQK